MKGMRLSGSAPTPMLVEENIPLPQLEGDVLVHVFAACVTSKELLWYPTTHNKNGEP